MISNVGICLNVFENKHCYATNYSFLFRNLQNHSYDSAKLHYVCTLRRSSLSPIQNQMFSEATEPLPDMALIENKQNDGICFWAIISTHNPSACSNNKYIQHKKHLLFTLQYSRFLVSDILVLALFAVYPFSKYQSWHKFAHKNLEIISEYFKYGQ